MEHSLVDFERQDQIGFVTLNNPQKRNVLSRAALSQLIARLEEAEAAGDVRVVILRAAGPVFSAGHDLAEIVGATDAQRESLFALCTQAMQCVRGLSLPVIAQVQGLATAAGCQLAATCDLIVAVEEASFATPGIKIGLFCSTPAVAVSRAVGQKKAMEMLRSNGGDLQAVAKALGGEVKTTDLFTRGGAAEGLGSGALLSEAFNHKVGDVVGPIGVTNQQVVAKLIDKVEPDEKELASKRDQIVQQIQSQKAQERAMLFEDGLIERLKKDGKIKTHQDVVQKLMQRYRG